MNEDENTLPLSRLAFRWWLFRRNLNTRKEESYSVTKKALKGLFIKLLTTFLHEFSKIQNIFKIRPFHISYVFAWPQLRNQWLSKKEQFLSRRSAANDWFLAFLVNWWPVNGELRHIPGPPSSVVISADGVDSWTRLAGEKSCRCIAYSFKALSHWLTDLLSGWTNTKHHPSHPYNMATQHLCTICSELVFCFVKKFSSGYNKFQMKKFQSSQT